MALVNVLDFDTFRKIGKKRLDTDVAQFFYDKDKAVQLIMKNTPEVMEVPEAGKIGSIRINKHKTVPLNSDNTFYYGAWPQELPPDTIIRHLDKKEARQTINYYKIKGKTYYEYEWNTKRYIKINGGNKWFEIKFIKWIYDPNLKKAYTEKALWNIDESDEKALSYFWLQAFQSTKKMSEKQKQSNLHNRLKSGVQNLNKNLVSTSKLMSVL